MKRLKVLALLQIGLGLAACANANPNGGNPGAFDISFGDALLGVLAQRLAPALCPACRAMTPGSRDDWDRHAEAYGRAAFEVLHPFDEKFTVWTATGCKSCRSTGYKGRVALHELLVTDEALRSALARRSPAEELREIAIRGGMTTLLQDGIEKALAGRTDLAQALAVANR